MKQKNKSHNIPLNYVRIFLLKLDRQFADRQLERRMINMARSLTMAGVFFTAALALAACGTSQTDRGLSGAGIGAGVGAVGGTLLGGDPVTGAAVGAAVGGATGVLTDSDDIDLGDPIWR